jgi:hypothetical protein
MDAALEKGCCKLACGRAARACALEKLTNRNPAINVAITRTIPRYFIGDLLSLD